MYELPWDRADTLYYKDGTDAPAQVNVVLLASANVFPSVFC